MPDVYEEANMDLREFAERWHSQIAPADINIMRHIDDLFFPWPDKAHRRSGLVGLHDGSAPWKTWHMWEDYGCSKEAWLDVVTSATLDGMYSNTPPYEGSVAAWNRLLWELGPRVGLHLVTARGFMEHAEDIRLWTPEWVTEYAIAHHTLSFEKDKVAAQAKLGVRFDYAIDDGVHNYEALDADGVKVYLLSRPHNREFPAERRVDSIDEFVDIVLKEVS